MVKRLDVLSLIVADVSEYWSSFYEPMPVNYLARKYWRHVKAEGGTVAVMIGLHNKGALHLLMGQTGARYVFPIAIWNEFDEITREDWPSRIRRVQRQRKAQDRERELASVIPIRG